MEYGIEFALGWMTKWITPKIWSWVKTSKIYNKIWSWVKTSKIYNKICRWIKDDDFVYSYKKTKEALK